MRKMLNDWDLRVDVYTAGVLNVDNADSYPGVVVTHIPTGIVERDSSTPSPLLNRVAAMTRLEQRIAGL